MNAGEMLFREAHEKLEENRFDEACSLYRQATMTSEPNQRQLGNLAVAEEEGCLQFRRELCGRYPRSLQCKLSFIQALHSASRFTLAVQLASEVISDCGLSENENLLVRLIRLKNAVATTRYELIYEDFAQLWNAGEDNVAARRCRKSILASLTSCDDPNCEETFERMSELPFLSEQVAKLFTIKAEELRTIRLVLDKSNFK